MSEYDRADFKGVYEGKSLLKSAEITNVPWEIGEPQPIVSDILKNITHSGRLLDVGCGLGRNAKAAYDCGFNVIAIDTSSAAIDMCRQQYADSEISFLVLDACDTTLSPVFDIILDSAAYHAIPIEKRLIYLKEMYRLSSEKTVFHLITFAPSLNGMPKPLASELSEITHIIEASGWKIKLAERVEYKGNAVAIEDFQEKKGLNIQLDNNGRTRLPAWHLVLHTTI
ncbi:class I SAM-dependent methyltransferase [Endozoicomonas sp. SM1973]|uniref:Class I SAM-dependent methyltransferase n=1 Tax=Spartinivicinus marinus TaxID=2994442 RepID=A0A853I6J9_9GAMM|nr:class I SAM-dependent methyltransferase [Spartinivicinus marinus]MCX4028180.1 class I SAM-dependent methyltransferase [Spartinivicinus marinus]NYZ68379.1 class I SAM-dependent methyltransferase [Spartinivicinus marinus]